MLELALKRGEMVLMRQSVSDGPVTIGRAPDNTLRLSDPEISRHHLKIERKGHALHLSDLSSNGTIINGKLHRTADIHAGDRLEIGPWTITVEEVGDFKLPKTVVSETCATRVIQFDASKKQLTTEAIEFSVKTQGRHALRRKITAGEIIIGHHPGCDIRTNDPYVSRRHCKLVNDNGQLKLFDLASTNGTFVNDTRISEVTLPPRGSFRIGSTDISFRLVRSSERIKTTKVERLGQMIGPSRVMRELFALIERIGPTDATVCLLGESGTGKELAARELHNLSPRRRAPFVAVNCGALPQTIIESELFGHERGAFTGAVERMAGVFEQANGGTIFLDEIAEMPLDLQTRLLRVLDTKSVRRIGGQEDIKIDVRVICATNRNLKNLVTEGLFREDLFFRIFVVPVTLPPLRERREDIKALARHFVGDLSRGKKKMSMTSAALKRLMNMDWPGNVRELKNTIERTILLLDSDVINIPDLKIERVGGAQEGEQSKFRGWERQTIVTALDECNGNLSRACKRLGIARTTLQSKIRRYKIEVQKNPVRIGQ